ncbi:MAG: hypothetical protein JWO80_3584 [Bryobacterales bacterium]|nr:hypothetical protein [Bryobacterales bacterium]
MRTLLVALLLALAAPAANDVPVPTSCTPEVNRKLAELVASGQRNPVDNVMVCGITTGSSHTQRGGPHGDHQIIPVLVTFPDKSTHQIEIVTNDALDGKITAPPKALVFAYGQAFFDQTGQFAAGIHETHCATHRGADNGWIIVNGARHPTRC